ncbi:Sh3 and multiple ankyrin repeat domains protein 3 [Plakobranchus ocellatus]|uniref:Sh3 and multiple ankyrin repeat domains protein 3 n=1 Tax=Plakobranchus ocellatus TaxID=259542 RepID=A0AAV4CA09_9GAST|nr:Sh3 and multiple ankyrin repeat domains protein 3 [Plakobranchus ocellatus]
MCTLTPQACKHGRVQHLEHLLFYGADMDVRNSCGNTALHVCALNGQEACARVLMFRGADPTLLNYSNQTADQAATIAGNLAIAELIMSHNPDDVVPYREIPQYSQRRQAGGSLTPSLRALIRSRSDPRINWAGLRQGDDARSPSSTTSSSMSPARWRGQNGAVPMMDSDSACSISVSSTGSGTGGSDLGPSNGRHVTGRGGGYIQGGPHVEGRMRRAESMGDVHQTRGINQRNTLATLVRIDRDFGGSVVKKHAMQSANFFCSNFDPSNIALADEIKKVRDRQSLQHKNQQAFGLWSTLFLTLVVFYEASEVVYSVHMTHVLPSDLRHLGPRQIRVWASDLNKHPRKERHLHIKGVSNHHVPEFRKQIVKSLPVTVNILG